MSASGTSRRRALSGRVLPVPLRLKVMAGVVAVTLAALTAFDVGVVATMRRYLLSQVSNSLQLALAVTEPKLTPLLAQGAPAPPRQGPGPTLAAGQGKAHPGGAIRRHVRIPVIGDFEVVFVARRRVEILEAATVRGGLGQPDQATRRPAEVVNMQSDTARRFAKPGMYTARIGSAEFRLLSARVKGGSLIVGTSLDQVTETASRVKAVVALGSVVVVLLIGLGVVVVVRRGLRPVEMMAREADQITGGDLTGRVAVHDPGSEVGRLGAALNGMLARIQDSQQQMRRFFGDASHELRTPLASLRANAQLYQQGALQDPGEVEEVMDRIVLETRRMGRLVDDMLGLARLGEQPCQSREPVNLTAVVTGCAERARIADSGRAWQARIADGLTVTGDEELLRRAVDNLLTNVLVHTPADTACAISASAADGCVTIEVRDDGPGVPAEHLPHIADRFYRARTLPGARGSGLGLAIADEIISAHSGTLTATPVSPHGLRITLTLPRRASPVAG